MKEMVDLEFPDSRRFFDGYRILPEGGDSGSSNHIWNPYSFLVLSASAQSVHVRGKVTNAAGNPLANVTLELVRAKLNATTGGDGLFSLGSGTAIGRRSEEKKPLYSGSARRRKFRADRRMS